MLFEIYNKIIIKLEKIISHSTSRSIEWDTCAELGRKTWNEIDSLKYIIIFYYSYCKNSYGDGWNTNKDV